MKNESLALQILRYQTKYEDTVLITLYYASLLVLNAVLLVWEGS